MIVVCYYLRYTDFEHNEIREAIHSISLKTFITTLQNRLIITEQSSPRSQASSNVHDTDLALIFG